MPSNTHPPSGEAESFTAHRPAVQTVNADALPLKTQPLNEEVKRFSVASIRRDTFRRIQDPDEKAAFAADIKANGQRVAGVLAVINGELWPADCNRRLEALIANGETEILAYVDPRITTKAQLLAMQIGTQNRTDLHCLEMAERVAALMAADGLNQAECSARLGLSPTKVSHLLSLLDLPADVRAMLADGSVTAAHAAEVASLDVGRQAELLRLAATNKLGTRALRKLVKPKPKPLPKFLRLVEGRVTVVFPAHMSVGDFRADLAKVVAALGDRLKDVSKAQVSCKDVFGRPAGVAP